MQRPLLQELACKRTATEFCTFLLCKQAPTGKDRNVLVLLLPYQSASANEHPAEALPDGSVGYLYLQGQTLVDSVIKVADPAVVIPVNGVVSLVVVQHRAVLVENVVAVFVVGYFSGGPVIAHLD